MVRIQIDEVEPGEFRDLPYIKDTDQAEKLVTAAEGFSHVGHKFLDMSNGKVPNPLIQTFKNAFAHHFPVELSPDVVFNTILQSISVHIAEDPEKYRQKFVDHEGRKKLVHRDDTLVKGDWQNNWKFMIDGLSAQILDNLNSDEPKNILTTTFSTTDHAAATAHKGVFMDVVKAYFEYYCITMCGIPWIEVTGAREDWQKMKNTVLPFAKNLDLDAWCGDLTIIFDQILSAFDGNVEREFWKRTYKYHGASGSGDVASASGWIAHLFLFVKMGRNKLIGKLPEMISEMRKPKQPPIKWDPSKPIEIVPMPSRHEKESIEFADFPKGLTSTPFQWLYLHDQFDMTLNSGLVGVTRTPEGALKPVVGWVIAEAKDEPEKDKNKRDRISIGDTLKIWSDSGALKQDPETIDRKLGNPGAWKTNEDVWRYSPMFSGNC